MSPAVADSRLDAPLAAVARAWDQARFQSADDDAELAALRQVESQSIALTQQFPGEARPVLWQALVLASEADASGPASALGLARRAKRLLETAAAMGPDPATAGGIHTLLGVLYYQAPGWPIAFGDRRQAEAHLRDGLRLTPQSVEANFYLGDFLVEQHRYAEAIPALRAALNAPARPGREVADAGFRRDAQELLATAVRRASN